MNSLISSILVQCFLLLFMVILGLILTKFTKENFVQRKTYSMITSLFFFGFAIGVFSAFLTGFYTSSIINIKETIPIILFYSYSFELGLQLTLTQSIIYLSSMFAIAIVNCYLAWKKTYWNEKYISLLTVLGILLIFLVLSSNFFQLLLFILLSDSILILLTKNLILKSKKRFPDSLKKMTASYFVGNILLFVSSIIISRLARSLDFKVIINNISENPSIYEPFSQLIVCLFLVGIIFKNSYIPFHMWFKEICSSNEDGIFMTLSVSFVVTLSMIFITPLDKLLLWQGSTFYIWYGLILTLVCVVFAIFLRKNLESSIFIFTINSGLLVFLLGLKQLGIAFHLLIIMFVLTLGLVPFMFSKETQETTEIQNTEKFNVSLTIVRFSIFVVLTATLLGVSPLNSTFLLLVQTLRIAYSWSNIIFFILSLVIFYGIFGFIYLIYKKQLKLAVQYQLKWLEIIFSLVVVIFISLGSTLYSTFSLLNPYPFTLVNPITILPYSDFDFIWMSLVAVLVGCFLILISFIIFNKFLPNISLKISKISTKTENIFRSIYSFDFVFLPIGLFWNKIIIPSAKWFNRIIIQKFLIEIILFNSWKFIVYFTKLVSRTIKNILIPQIIRLFKFLSNSIQKLEIAKIKTQIQIVLLSLSLLLMVVIILYSGGVI